MYLSVVLRPKVSLEKTSLLSFVAALAVAKTITTYGVPAVIKWPNDVRVNGRKIAGILLESEGGGPQIDYVVVGIGINLAVDPKRLSAEIQGRSTSLSNEQPHPVDYHDFLQTFFLMFQKGYDGRHGLLILQIPQNLKGGNQDYIIFYSQEGKKGFNRLTIF